MSIDALYTDLNRTDRVIRSVVAMGLFLVALLGELSPEWQFVVILAGIHAAMSAALGWDPAYSLLKATVTRISRVFEGIERGTAADHR